MLSKLYGVLENPESRGWSQEPGCGLDEGSGGGVLEGTGIWHRREQQREQPGQSRSALDRFEARQEAETVRAGVPADRRGRHVGPVHRCQDFRVQSQRVGSIAAQRLSVVGVRGGSRGYPSKHRGHSQKPRAGGLDHSGGQEFVQRRRSLVCFDRRANGRVSVGKSGKAL